MNRDIKLSNIKGFLIFLVVFGHLIGLYKNYYSILHLVIYSFHMPMFVFISGYFAKNASPKKIINFILLYLMFQPFYRWLLMIFEDKEFDLKLEIPYFHLWYLVSMAVWYLLYMVIKKALLSKRNKILILSACFVISIGSRYLSEAVVNLFLNIKDDFYPYTLSYQRTLSFLLFFFLGVLLSKERMNQLYQSLKAKWIVAVMMLVAVFLYFVIDGVQNKEEILKGSFGVYQMEGSLMSITVDILLGYLIASLVIYIMLNIITDKICFLTKWGDRSLPVFLFHTIFVLTFKKFSVFKEFNAILLLVLLIAASYGITSILSSDWFTNFTYYLWHPVEVIDRFEGRMKSRTNDSR